MLSETVSLKNLLPIHSFLGNYWKMCSSKMRNKIRKEDDMGSNIEGVRISKTATGW